MIKQSSNVYQIFLNTFFQDDSAYPFRIECPTPGKAISLAQKLNQCRKQHIGEAPAEICPISAKAENTSVILGARGSRNPREAEWIRAIAEGQRAQGIGAQGIGVSDSDTPGSDSRPERLDSQDELLKKYYGVG